MMESRAPSVLLASFSETDYEHSLKFLSDDERAEFDTHLVALTSGRVHVEYRSDPIAWAAAILGIPANSLLWSLSPEYAGHVWDGDADPLALLFRAVRDGRNCGVESGTGTGKSFAMAVLILWFLACYEDSRVFTFAPKEDQLRPVHLGRDSEALAALSCALPRRRAARS